MVGSSPGSGRASGKLLVGGLVAFGLLLVAAQVAIDFYIDVLWHTEVGYAPVFWKRTFWSVGTRLGAGLLVALVLFLNLRLVARTLSGIQIKRRFGDLEINEKLPKSYVLWAIVVLSVLLGLWFGGSVTSGGGLRLLLAFRAEAWGVVDPVLGRDLSYYVFVLPLLREALAFGLVTTFLTFTLCVGGYAATGALRWGKSGVSMGNLPRVHLGAVVAFFLLLLSVQFHLGRYVLLQFGNSDVQSIFGFADAHARLPGLRVLAVLSLVAAFLVLWGSWKNRVVPVLTGTGLVVVGGLVVGQFWPSLVQRFRVEPNELERETPYIRHNIEFSRLGFGLSEMRRERFEYAAPEEGDGVDWAAARRQFEGLPVWSEGALLTTFRELEARFDYYEFETVQIDRYEAPDGAGGTRLKPVAVSAREIDQTGIPDPNWQNLRIRERYIAGMGAVAAAATERTPEGRPEMYVSAIPPEFAEGVGAPPGLRLSRPSVYVGSRLQGYAILNPSEETFLDSLGVPGTPGVDYPEGIPLHSLPRTLAFAWRFQDWNLFFAQEVTRASRFVFRRQVTQRAREVAPFFEYPEAPYPVVHEGRLVWILEGFTATRRFPLSSPQELSFRREANYVRNSVKVAVDALTGEMHFYALLDEDPMLAAFDAAFPGLLTPLEEMPEGLRRHVRYSRRHLELQAAVLLQYHQDTAPQFHGQQDVWDRPRELSQTTTPVPYEPEYGVYRLPGEEEARFRLTTVFVPRGRQNLTAILTGALRADGSRELILYDVPVEDQVPGPRQVEALVEQDPEISQQFSLWRTGGSQVWTGHLHLVPVGDRILYMEPVFLAAEADAIPQLRGLVVSDGNRVVMEPSLRGAVEAIAGGEVGGPPEETAGEATDVADVATEGGEGAATVWSREALEILDRAEARLRDGDYQGFGQALEELRALLERLREGSGSER